MGGRRRRKRGREGEARGSRRRGREGGKRWMNEGGRKERKGRREDAREARWSPRQTLSVNRVSIPGLKQWVMFSRILYKPFLSVQLRSKLGPSNSFDPWKEDNREKDCSSATWTTTGRKVLGRSWGPKLYLEMSGLRTLGIWWKLYQSLWLLQPFHSQVQKVRSLNHL